MLQLLRFLLSGALIMAFSGIVAAQAPLPHSDDPGDCATCHRDVQMLPDGHVPTAGMRLEDCVACHAPATPLDLHPVMPLDHFHMLAGVTCQTCHEDADPPMQMSSDQCLACHGPLEDLAERTAETQPTNPHGTPHGPPYAACDLCHRVHTESENFCAQCHDFDFTVP